MGEEGRVMEEGGKEEGAGSGMEEQGAEEGGRVGRWAWEGMQRQWEHCRRSRCHP